MDKIVRPHGLCVDDLAFEAIQLAADHLYVSLFGPSSGDPLREDPSRAAA